MEGNVKSINMDLVTEDLGAFGRYQMLVFALAWLSTFFSGLNLLTAIFGGAVLPHRCKIPSCDTSTSLYSESFLPFTTPWDEDRQAWEECQYFPSQPPNGSLSMPHPGCFEDDFDPLGEEGSCDEWIYDRSLFLSTTASYFDLSCERSWLVPAEMICIMSGTAIGSLIIGFFSDLYGRKIGFLISSFLISGAGLLGALSTNLFVFLGFRFLAGIGVVGGFNVAFIAAIELMGPKWRVICGILLNIPFAFGEATLGFAAYFIRSWRYLHMVICLPAIVLFSYYWIMPEGVRWLVSQNRHEEALIVLKHAAKFNGKEISPNVEEMLRSEGESKEQPRLNIFALMKSRVSRNRSLILFFCWIVCAQVYYGLSTSVGTLSGNFFLNFTLVVLIEVPAFICSAFASNTFGRKKIVMAAFLIGGIACGVSVFIPSDLNIVKVILILVGKFGITSAFATIYVYSGELYPTEYRAVAVGTCSMYGRFGSIMAPLISNLSRTYKPLPSIIFASLSFVACGLIAFLPDTAGETLPQTLKESEDIGKNRSGLRYNLCCQTS